MTIDPWRPPVDLSGLAPETPAWTLRLTDHRFSLYGVLCEVAWLDSERPKDHPWLDCFAASSDRTVELVKTTVLQYLKAHAREHLSPDPRLEQARVEFFRAWREHHGVMPESVELSEARP